MSSLRRTPKPKKDTQLTVEDRKNLINHFRVTPTVEAAAQLVRLDDEQARKYFGIGDRGDMSGVAFSGHDITGTERGPYCVRLDHVEKGKYRSLPGSDGRYLYCLPGADERKDSPVIVVESPKSVLAVTSAAERAGRMSWLWRRTDVGDGSRRSMTRTVNHSATWIC